MAQEQTPKPGSGGDGRSGSADKSGGGAKGGASDTKPPPPKRG